MTATKLAMGIAGGVVLTAAIMGMYFVTWQVIWQWSTQPNCWDGWPYLPAKMCMGEFIGIIWLAETFAVGIIVALSYATGAWLTQLNRSA